MLNAVVLYGHGNTLTPESDLHHILEISNHAVEPKAKIVRAWNNNMPTHVFAILGEGLGAICWHGKIATVQTIQSKKKLYDLGKLSAWNWRRDSVQVGSERN